MHLFYEKLCRVSYGINYSIVIAQGMQILTILEQDFIFQEFIKNFSIVAFWRYMNIQSYSRKIRVLVSNV